MRLSIINITIIGLLLITGCSTKDKNSSKEVKLLSVNKTKLQPAIDTLRSLIHRYCM